MEVSSYAARALCFASKAADRTGPFALVVTGIGLVLSYLFM